MPINPKKIFMLWPKKNSYKKFDNQKKNSCGWKIPPPSPHNVSNGPSLRELYKQPGVFERHTSTGSGLFAS